MNNNIRHIILPMLTAIACVVASCTSDLDSESWGVVSKEEIKFELATASRTVVTTDSNITDQAYMLFGDIRLGERHDSIFNWQRVEFNGKNWDYGTPQYWFMGHEHSFVAIHPFINKGDSQVEILDYTDSKLSFTYHLPDTLENAKDLLFATHRRKYTLDNSGSVQFEFTHLLPRINISMALIEKELMYDHVDKKDPINQNEYIAVNSIEFQGIKTRASFTFTPKALKTNQSSTNDYEMSYLMKDDTEVETITVTLDKPCHVPNSYKERVTEGLATDSIPVEYVTALQGEEIVVMLPQSFDPDSDAKIVVNYSINDDNDLMRRIVIPLKGTTWKEGTFYTYKFLIDNAYFGHIVDDGVITVDIDDFRLHGEHEAGDDSWITDYDDPDHNIGYTYDDEGNCGPNKPEQ